jgi:acyl-CoA dehydrogenase
LPVSALVSVGEPMGERLYATPFLANTLACAALLRCASPTLLQGVLPELIAGRASAAIALHEPHGSFELAHIAAQAVASPNGFSFSGIKSSVLDGQNAEWIVIAARLHDQPALFLVSRAQLQGRITAERIVDETRRSARIDLNALQVEESALLDQGSATSALEHVQRLAWLLLAADMCGGTEGVLQLTLEWLRIRKQFGKPIGSYQALKHPMAEIMCSLEEGRSLLYRAATAFEADAPDCEIALRMAKAQLGETYMQAADRSIQFHGAIGFTYECHAQLFLRRAQWDEHSFGDGMHQRRHLGELLWR